MSTRTEKGSSRRRRSSGGRAARALAATLFGLAALAAMVTPGAPAPLAVPDQVLVNERGERVRLVSDVLKDRVVVINFIFTTCGTICPPLGANFGRLRKLLGERAGREVELVSISVDPETDTPERLRAWASAFGQGQGPGWTLLTGARRDVGTVLAALGFGVADKRSHTPLVLIGSAASGAWTRANGLAPPATLLAAIDAAGAPGGVAGARKVSTAAPATAGPQAPAAPQATASMSAGAAARYFTDVVLVDQDGRERRLYTDLMKGKTVVIDTFFTGCAASCPTMAATFAYLQEKLAPRLGRDVALLSISVDPDADTPEKLKQYAARFKAQPGWSFLTGRRDDVKAALGRLGQWVEERGDHSNVLLVGNDRTGLWKKGFGLARREEVLALVESVIEDGR
jgi:protein SCO1/2